jgi:hypothetical protein
MATKMKQNSGLTLDPNRQPTVTDTSTSGQSVLSGGFAGFINQQGLGKTGATGPSGLTKAEQIKQYTSEYQSADFTTVQYVANSVYQSLMGI